MIKRKDGKPACEIFFIQCAGSRTLNTFLLLRDLLHGLFEAGVVCAGIRPRRRPTSFQGRWTRVSTKFLPPAAKRSGVFLTRGEVTEVQENEDKSFSISLENTLFGESLELKADLVVLALGQVPSTLEGESALNLQYRQGPDHLN